MLFSETVEVDNETISVKNGQSLVMTFHAEHLGTLFITDVFLPARNGNIKGHDGTTNGSRPSYHNITTLTAGLGALHFQKDTFDGKNGTNLRR